MTTRTPKSGYANKALALFITLAMLAASLAGCSSFGLGQIFSTGTTSQSSTAAQTTPPAATTQPAPTTIKETIISGVSINGVAVSGMTKAEALSATANVPAGLLAKITFTITVDGVKYAYTAKDLGIATDYDDVVAQAIAFGQTGSTDNRKLEADQAANGGKVFTVRATAMKESVKAALQSLKTKVDKAPVNASAVFFPNGYTADGKAYTPDPRKLADANAVGKSLDRPKLTLIDPANAPSALRYQYWQTDHYIKGYIPADSNISHFQYTPEVKGLSLDIDALADQVVAQVKSGTYTPITVASHAVEASLKLADVKKGTQLISSWTSSYHSHYGFSRNWNVSRIASFINGTTIQPGQSWSVNKTAGPRNESTAITIGWKKAAGILNGGFTDQEGGGVCQLGSTTFNAAIRAGITIASSTHHTIPSGYIPLGLDATISTPAPDLVLKNSNTMPVYLVSYVNPKDQNVTVEVYGQQPVDPTYGPVIYDFTSDNRGTRYGTPIMKTVFNATAAPDDTVLSAAKPVYVYAEPRAGTQIQTYKRIYSLDGKSLCDPIPYENHKYPVLNGTTYVFGSAYPTATPAPTPTTAPTAAPTITPPA